MKDFFFTLCLLFLMSCGNASRNEKHDKKDVVCEQVFTLPDVPSMFITAKQKSEFLAENYWTNFDFKDTAQISQSHFLNKLFTDYISLLSQVPLSTACKGIKRLMSGAEADSLMFSYFFSIGEKYFYDPNSPVRNESLYIAMLEKVLASDKVDNFHKIRPQHQYEMALKNRPGKKALDFCYTLSNGRNGMLYNLRFPYVLLYFNNPGCGDCKRTFQQLIGSKVLNDLINKGNLIILSVYPDENLTEWKKEGGQIPTSWINAYDKSMKIKLEELYDLKAIPTLYLLDKEKRVLLKDARFEEIENYLGR